MSKELLGASCFMQDNYVALDVNGKVAVCRGCMASKDSTTGDYLSTPLAELQSKRGSHPLCRPYMSSDSRSSSTMMIPNFDEIGERERAHHGVRPPDRNASAAYDCHPFGPSRHFRASIGSSSQHRSDSPLKCWAAWQLKLGEAAQREARAGSAGALPDAGAAVYFSQ